MFTLSLASRAKAGGDEAGFEDKEFGLAQDPHGLHRFFLSTEGQWRDQEVRI